MDTLQPSVLAFYYPWYSYNSQKTLHWEGVNTQQKHIQSSHEYPLLGPYNSPSQRVINQHFQWAQKAGIQGFIVSWWGINSFEDKVIPKLIIASKKYHMSISLYYEKIPEPVSEKNVIKDITYLYHHYIQDNPAWFTINGHPCLFIYQRSLKQLHSQEPHLWKKLLKKINQQLGCQLHVCVDGLKSQYLSLFDSIHTYNILSNPIQKKISTKKETLTAVRNIYQYWKYQCRRVHKPVIMTVMPGYNDTSVRTPGDKLQYQTLYEDLWRLSLSFQPDIILITSWNEWHENTQIEPSLQKQDYLLRITKEMNDKLE